MKIKIELLVVSAFILFAAGIGFADTGVYESDMSSPSAPQPGMSNTDMSQPGMSDSEMSKSSTPDTGRAAGKDMDTSSMTIAEAIEKCPEHQTLFKALTAAGLVEQLKGEGPFTLFAPSDEAFNNLPPGALEELLANKDKLKKVLLLHVIADQLDANQIANLKEAMTAAGQKFKITKEGDSLMIGNAKVTETDYQCKNGVIHLINAVIESD